MKFVFASDSFKGSLTSAETGAALTAAARAVFGECETCVAPIADGGEGVAAAVLSARGGRLIERVVRDPLGAPTRASFGMLSDTEAIIEMASASGLTLVRPEARNPEVTSTYGTGELVRAALELGAAGGLGAALRILFNAELKSGIEVMLDLVRFDDLSRSADLIVTGEGRADGQSANGKVLSGVGRRARRLGVPCVALCGSVGDGYRALYDSGISCIMTTVDSPMPLADALARARELYYDGAVRLFQLVKIGFELGARRRSAQ